MSTSKSSKQSRTVTRKAIAKKASRPTNISKSRRRADHESHCLREIKYAAACEFLRSDSTLTIAGVARDFDLDDYTLRRRHLGLTKAPKDAHEHEAYLSKAQRAGFAAWFRCRATSARPVTQLGFRLQVKALTGFMPSRAWVSNFEATTPGIVFTAANGLDPRRAACFNSSTISTHFDALKHALDLGITPENIYNFDEQVTLCYYIFTLQICLLHIQGVQFGGSRNKLRQKFFFGHSDKARYRLRSDNLELVTILDAVCADGTRLEPGFVFQGGQTMEAAWFLADRPNITCVYFHLQ
jgi:hypothetical protein